MTYTIDPEAVFQSVQQKYPSQLFAPRYGHEFEDHMSPDVCWIGNPEYDKAFDEIMTKENDMAATTNTVDPRSGHPTSFPAFINIRFEDGKAIVSMRGDPKEVPADGDNDAYWKAGKQTEATFLQGDWDQFVAEATRERGLVPGG